MQTIDDVLAFLREEEALYRNEARKHITATIQQFAALSQAAAIEHVIAVIEGRREPYCGDAQKGQEGA